MYSEAYPTGLQAHFLACAIHDTDTFARCHHLLRDIFDDPLVPALRYVEQQYDQSRRLPSLDLVQAATGVELKLLDDFDQAWFLCEFEKFVRHRQLEGIVMEGFDLIARGTPEQIIERATVALRLSLSDQHREHPRLSLTDLLARPTPEQLVPDLLFEQQVSMTYGASQNLKSFVGLHIASALAHGREWVDARGARMRLKKRRVIYVAAEGGAMFGLRRLAWMIDNKLPIAEDWLYVIDHPINLLDHASVLRFIGEMRDLEDVGLVVFDTLSASIAGNSDSKDEVASLAVAHMQLIARELGCHVNFVHHEGKDSERGYRGSSALFANVDTVLRAERLTGTLTVKLTVEKQKDGVDRLVFSFAGRVIALGSYDSRGKERTSVAMSQLDPFEVKRIDQERNESALIADRRAIAQFTGGKEMSVNKVTDAITDAGVFRHVSGERLGKTKVRERITAALPPDVEVVVRLDGNRVARMTRPSPVNGKPNLVITTFHALEI